jgi:diguanylate cyclase (GGDEF)-like protein
MYQFMNELFRRTRFHLTQEQKLSLPANAAIMALCGLLCISSPFFDSALSIHWFLLIFGLGGMIYTGVTAVYILPILKKYPFLKWVLACLNGALISGVMHFGPPAAHGPALVFCVVLIIASAILLDYSPTYLFALICFLSDRLFSSLTPPFLSISYFVDSAPIPLAAFIAIETIRLLRKNNDRQVHRLEVLNMVANSVSSSLEIKQVIALLNSAIQNALDADTYYVGLINDGDESLQLELLYDDGEFFPPTDLPLNNTLAGWVIRNGKPLRLGNLPQDMPALGIKRFVIGKQRASLSWMGTPLQAKERTYGLVAVGSYRPDEFNEEDFGLLRNIAQQATMAIDNAYHHAEVERQSKLDSLTGVLNHGSFIQSLDEKIADALVTNSCLSVIMLDIDKFKTYNDNYGHLVGDQVLSRLTEIIREHIRDTDLVGRWGGEEFSIALPNADATHAFCISRRIQTSLSEIQFTARDGSIVPAPTVSLGIAELPNDAASTFSLIDSADQRLYIAKNRGRNEIEPRQEFRIESIRAG